MIKKSCNGTFIISLATFVNVFMFFGTAFADDSYIVNPPKGHSANIITGVEAVEPASCKPTPCTPCPPKTAGSSLLIGMVGIGGAAGISLKPRRRKEKKVQDKEK
jgi:hypothetical protein